MIVQITPPAISNIGWRTYIIFAVLNSVWVPIIYFFFPETKGTLNFSLWYPLANREQASNSKTLINYSERTMAPSMRGTMTKRRRNWLRTGINRLCSCSPGFRDLEEAIAQRTMIARWADKIPPAISTDIGTWFGSASGMYCRETQASWLL